VPKANLRTLATEVLRYDRRRHIDRPATGRTRQLENIVHVKGSLEFTVTERDADRIVSEMPITPGITNPFGVVHAGAILWFADVTATVLVMGDAAPTADMKGFPLAISLNANFVGNQREGSLKAVASFVKKGRTVSVVRTVVSGAEGRLIAEVTTSHVLSQ
jgi:1,4-dihydroxy-2-naphthoyl-CoA hydrolase